MSVPGEAPKPSNRGPWIIGGSIVLAALLIGGALVLISRMSQEGEGGAHPPRRLFGLTGSLTYNFDTYSPGIGLPDVFGDEMATMAAPEIESVPVLIRNGQGQVIGRGQTSLAQVETDSAVVSFALEIPEATLYVVEVGGVSGPTYTFEELRAENFDIALEKTMSPDEFLNLVCPTKIEEYGRPQADLGCPWLWGE